MTNLSPWRSMGPPAFFLLFFSLLFQVQLWAQPLTTVVCNDLVSVALDNNCTATIEPDQILEGGPYGPPSDYLVEIDKAHALPNVCSGPWLPNTLGANDVGQTYCVRVTYIVNGNACWSNLQIVDNLPPSLTCPNNTTVGMDASSCYHIAANGEFDPLVTEYCSATTLKYTLFPITFGNSGSGNNTLDGIAFKYLDTQVKWVGTDASGNTSSCTFTVQVKDLQAPQITCPGNLTLNTDPGECTYTVQNTELDPTSWSENCPLGLSWGLSGTNTDGGNNTMAGYVMQAGLTNVSWALIENYTFNIVSCSFDVQINDNEAPTISCPNAQQRDADLNQCTYATLGTEFDASNLSDNCPGLGQPQYTLSGGGNGSGTLSGHIFSKGPTTITWTVTDAAGNPASCSFNVIVKDNQAPTINCPFNQTRTLVSGCAYNTQGAEFNPSAWGDNCPGPSLAYVLSGATSGNGPNSLAGVAMQFGLNTVTWTVTDGNGATRTCAFLVSISTTAIEICNNLDDDCDGLVDEGVQLTFYADADGDGYGDINSTTLACTAPPGFVADNTDCEDADAAIHPNAVEICNNSIDDDCDGLLDESRHPDYDALIALYNATNGPGWYNKNGWASGALGVNCNVCTWYGVACNSAGRVTVLNLLNNNLSGTLPVSIGNITYLQTLDLSTNHLIGNLPVEIGNLLDLRVFSVFGNQLSGPIPTEFGNLIHLQHLSFGQNQFSGTIPIEIGDLQDLKVLEFGSNNFTGNIPPELGNLVNLIALGMSGNQLVGPIPATFGNLGNLNSLNLIVNQLSGCYAPALSSLCGAQMYLWANPGLPGGGSVQAWQAFCQNGTGGDADGDGYCKGTGAGMDCDDTNPAIHPGAIELCNNIDDNCNGQIDETSAMPDYLALMDLYNATNGPGWINKTGWGTGCNVCGWYGVTCNSAGRVSGLSLNGNNLIGVIPNTIDQLTELENLFLSVNSLVGLIPHEIGSLTNLNILQLYHNQLIGTIPHEIGSLTNLNILQLYHNQLIGTIPPEIGNLSNLAELSLSENLLYGPIPPEIGNLANLKTLHLSNNSLTGSIPPEIGKLANLDFIHLGANALNGPIPPEIGNLANLTTLYLSSNYLNGSIPPEIGNLNNLQFLDLDHNQITGSIPPEIGNFTNAILLNLNNNLLFGCFPGTMSILCNGSVDLSNNPGLPGGGSAAAWAAFCSPNHTGGDFDGDSYCNGLGLGDCNDADPAIHPGAPELCNGLDDNCNGQTDENIISNFTASVVVSCSNPGGNKIVVSNLLGGTPPFKYGLNGSFQNVPTFSNLSAGTYQVTVKEANGPGCPLIKTIVVNPLMTLSTSSTNVSCNGAANGSVSVVVSGGTPNYTYVWRRGSIVVGNTATVTGLIADSYRVTVRDNNGTGCTKISGIVTISQPPALNLIKTSQINVSCNGGSNGKLTVIGNSGTPPYSYSWGSFGTNPTLSGLSAGTYTCTLSDANGCTKVGTYTITQPSLLTLAVVSVVPWTGGLKKVVIAASGGSPSYKYRVVPPGGNFLTPSTFYLAPGSYVFETRDFKGCITSLSYQLSFAGPVDERNHLKPFTEQDSAQPAEIILFPNPSEGGEAVYLRLINIETKAVSFSVSDAFGREIIQGNLAIIPNEPARLPFQNLPSGWYQVVIRPEDGSAFLKAFLITGK